MKHRNKYNPANELAQYRELAAQGTVWCADCQYHDNINQGCGYTESTCTLNGLNKPNPTPCESYKQKDGRRWYERLYEGIQIHSRDGNIHIIERSKIDSIIGNVIILRNKAGLIECQETYEELKKQYWD